MTRVTTNSACENCGQIVSSRQRHDITNCESYKRGKQARLKEVVNWIKLGNIAVYKQLDTGELEFIEPISSYPYWQAQLWEWGLNDK